jgi:hypothetical protein
MTFYPAVGENGAAIDGRISVVERAPLLGEAGTRSNHF